MRDTEDLSAGSVKMGPGTLYGSIKRMIDQGLVEETDDGNPMTQDRLTTLIRTIGDVSRTLTG